MGDSNPGTPGKEEEQKTDEKYNDEGADLVIVSSDNVRFYVQKFFVLAASTVFRGMIQDCTGTPAEVQLTDDSMEASSVIRLFLDLACGDHFADFDALVYDDVYELLKLCDKYDCSTSLQTIRLLVSRPLPASNVNNLYRFFYACALGDTETAHRLLPMAAQFNWAFSSTPGPAGSIVGEGCLSLNTMSTDWQDRLPRKYFQALLRASRLRLSQPQGTWQQVADDFKEQIKLQEVQPVAEPVA